MSEIELEEMFDEAIAAQQQAGVDGPEPEAALEPAAETTEQPEQLRDPETGQFESEQQREERLYAGRYKTVEELERGHGELLAKMGEQGNELGQWRQWGEQVQAAQQGQQAPPGMSEEDLGRLEQIALENPMAAAQWAVQARNPLAYQRVMQIWNEEDSWSAMEFHSNQKLAGLAKHFQDQFAQFAAPIAQQQATQSVASALQNVTARHPEMADPAFQMELEQTARSMDPTFLLPLQNGTQQAKEALIENLYFNVLGRRAAGGQQQAPQQPEQVAPPVPAPQGRPVGMEQRLLASVAGGPSPAPPASQPQTTKEAWEAMWDEAVGPYNQGS